MIMNVFRKELKGGKWNMLIYTFGTKVWKYNCAVWVACATVCSLTRCQELLWIHFHRGPRFKPPMQACTITPLKCHWAKQRRQTISLQGVTHHVIIVVMIFKASLLTSAKRISSILSSCRCTASLSLSSFLWASLSLSRSLWYSSFLFCSSRFSSSSTLFCLRTSSSCSGSEGHCWIYWNFTAQRFRVFKYWEGKYCIIV